MLTLFIFSILGGYALFHLILLLLPYIERRDHVDQKEEVLKEAKIQEYAIKKAASEQLDARLGIMNDELETFLAQKRDDLRIEEGELLERESLLEQESQQLNQTEDIQKELESAIKLTQVKIQEKEQELESSKVQLIHALEELAHTDSSSLKKSIAIGMVHEKQLELQKVMKFVQEELSSAGQKLARRVLDRVHARYAPEFVWPKTSNIVEVKDRSLHPHLLLESCSLIEELQEKSGVKIIPFQPADGVLFVKVAGGFGISREAVRLTLEKLFSQDLNQWNKASSIFSNQSTRLESEASRLGKKATDILGLKGIHSELQKLVGALNWRTSYRQNQWYHTIEVAHFASILAHELGVNPDDAKRVGLLHDIGKAIDYRIDGSHAVISGDYADRFGEKRYICDTVMSHHADLIVESPLAYVLQAADTLSGARPGARVNLEEGYQVRLTAIHDVVKSFAGIRDLAVMNGGREVHIQVHNEQVAELEVKPLTEAIARKIEQEVAYPGQIKILVTRTYESSAVA